MNKRTTARLDMVLWGVLGLAMIAALYLAFVDAPRERTMGDLQRIFYFHVAAAITGMTAFGVNFAAGVAYVARGPEVGPPGAGRRRDRVVFFAIVLITGPIWAKPVWMVWWTWSPRLTLSLVLCLLYIAYLLIRRYIEDPDRRAMIAAVFGIVAFVDAPLVWFSIRWWRDIHPAPMLESGGIDPAMRPAFWACVASFELLLVYLLRRRCALESMREEMERLERLAG